MNKRFLLILTIILSFAFYFHPQEEVKAFDPVTLAILTPVAIKAAQIMAPYVIRGLTRMGTTMLKGFVRLIQIYRLPLGLMECTVFAPWTFSAGLRNTWSGLCAPFLFAGYVALSPVAACGVNI